MHIEPEYSDIYGPLRHWQVKLGDDRLMEVYRLLDTGCDDDDALCLMTKIIGELSPDDIVLPYLCAILSVMHDVRWAVAA